ncbi:hypothetical protein ACSQ7D_00600 [Capnocytophaga sp. G1920]|uniref:hypothetical protein n=1 Tax=Capnocytophaga sp. G1920 TaxID=3448875 RepID=UPI003EDBEF9D
MEIKLNKELQKKLDDFLERKDTKSHKFLEILNVKELDNVVRAKSYVLQGGKRVLQVKRARLDIVVQEGVDISKLESYLNSKITQDRLNVIVNIIIK